MTPDDRAALAEAAELLAEAETLLAPVGSRAGAYTMVVVSAAGDAGHWSRRLTNLARIVGDGPGRPA